MSDEQLYTDADQRIRAGRIDPDELAAHAERNRPGIHSPMTDEEYAGTVPIQLTDEQLQHLRESLRQWPRYHLAGVSLAGFDAKSIPFTSQPGADNRPVSFHELDATLGELLTLRREASQPRVVQVPPWDWAVTDSTGTHRAHELLAERAAQAAHHDQHHVRMQEHADQIRRQAATIQQLQGQRDDKGLGNVTAHLDWSVTDSTGTYSARELLQERHDQAVRIASLEADKAEQLRRTEASDRTGLERLTMIRRHEKTIHRHQRMLDDRDTTITGMHETIQQLQGQLDDKIIAGQAMKDAYTERAALVAVLTKIWPSHMTEDEHEFGDSDFRNIACVHTPAGQATWHIHRDDLPLFDHVGRSNEPGPDGTACAWDGHTTQQKYERLASLQRFDPYTGLVPTDDRWLLTDDRATAADTSQPTGIVLSLADITTISRALHELVRRHDDIDAADLANRIEGMSPSFRVSVG